MTENQELQKLFEYLKELVEKKFYGELVLKLESGKIVIAKETKSIKF